MRPSLSESPPIRRAATAIAVMAVLGGAVLLPVGATAADEGPAPAAREYRVLADIHTDAISTFIDNGQLTLATKADVPEGSHTRFEAESVWFHVDNDAKMTLPEGFGFIAGSGAEVWMAPQVQNHATLWPGFSTESVPAGTLDGNITVLTLVSVAGPGDLELFENGAFGQVQRIWSSDEEGFTELTVGAQVHKHANWAFTSAGTYDITVRADASIGGVPQTDTATYTFVVGDLPEDVDTASTLAASSSDLVLGESTTLTAVVSPSGVNGFVEFRDGDTVLGHEQVVDGQAIHVADSLGIGSRSLTATFVPSNENLANASTSAPVQVTVTDGSGLDFGIRGVQDSYDVGDDFTATIVGYTLGENEEFRWRVSHADSGDSSWYLTTTGPTLGYDLDVSYNGWVLRGVVYDTVAQELVAETDPRQVNVTSLVDAPTLTWIDGPTVYLGSPASAAVETPGDLEEGDTVIAAFRQRGAWLPPEYAPTIDGGTLTHSLPFNMTGQVHLQVVRDGMVISQSAPYQTSHTPREVLLEGTQGVYRVGQELSVTATVFPMAESLSFEWRYRDGAGNVTTTPAIPDDNALFVFERALTLDDDGADLRRSATFPNAFGFSSTAGSGTVQIHVSDADPDEQLVALDNLAGHYHQGNTISLHLSADPEIADTDVIRWEWRWPGGEWTTIDGFDGQSEQLIAEQALDGVEVRATLTMDGNQSFTADPVTIHVDDHGAGPRQQVTVAGLSEQYVEGDQIELTATVDPTSVLERWEWYIQKAGESEPMLVLDENGPTLAFAADPDYDGAAVFAQLTFPDGSSYVESAPVLLAIQEDTGQPTTTISVTGLEDHYRVGDTMTLTAAQEPDTGEDHWHWFIRPADGADYLVIPGETSSTLTRQIGASDDGAMILARLYDHDHEVIAESDPVTVDVEGQTQEPGGPEKPGSAPEARTDADLVGVPDGGVVLSSATVKQGEVVAIGLDEGEANRWVAAWLLSTPRLLNGDWTLTNGDGTFAARIPVDAEIGDHQLAVFAADGALIGWANITVTAAGTVTPSGTLPQTGFAAGTEWIALPVLLLGAGLLMATTRRRRLLEG